MKASRRHFFALFVCILLGVNECRTVHRLTAPSFPARGQLKKNSESVGVWRSDGFESKHAAMVDLKQAWQQRSDMLAQEDDSRILTSFLEHGSATKTHLGFTASCMLILAVSSSVNALTSYLRKNAARNEVLAWRDIQVDILQEKMQKCIQVREVRFQTKTFHMAMELYAQAVMSSFKPSRMESLLSLRSSMVGITNHIMDVLDRTVTAVCYDQSAKSYITAENMHKLTSKLMQEVVKLICALVAAGLDIWADMEEEEAPTTDAPKPAPTSTSASPTVENVTPVSSPDTVTGATLISETPILGSSVESGPKPDLAHTDYKSAWSRFRISVTLIKWGDETETVGVWEQRLSALIGAVSLVNYELAAMIREVLSFFTDISVSGYKLFAADNYAERIEQGWNLFFRLMKKLFDWFKFPLLKSTLSFVYTSIYTIQSTYRTAWNVIRYVEDVEKYKRMVDIAKISSALYRMETNAHTCRMMDNVRELSEKHSQLMNRWSEEVSQLRYESSSESSGYSSSPSSSVDLEFLRVHVSNLCESDANLCYHIFTQFPEARVTILPLLERADPTFVSTLQRKISTGPITDLAVASTVDEQVSLTRLGFIRAVPLSHSTWLFVCKSCGSYGITKMKVVPFNRIDENTEDVDDMLQFDVDSWLIYSRNRLDPSSDLPVLTDIRFEMFKSRKSQVTALMGKWATLGYEDQLSIRQVEATGALHVAESGFEALSSLLSSLSPATALREGRRFLRDPIVTGKSLLLKLAPYRPVTAVEVENPEEEDVQDGVSAVEAPHGSVAISIRSSVHDFQPSQVQTVAVVAGELCHIELIRRGFERKYSIILPSKHLHFLISYEPVEDDTIRLSSPCELIHLSSAVAELAAADVDFCLPFAERDLDYLELIGSKPDIEKCKYLEKAAYTKGDNDLILEGIDSSVSEVIRTWYKPMPTGSSPPISDMSLFQRSMQSRWLLHMEELKRFLCRQDICLYKRDDQATVDRVRGLDFHSIGLPPSVLSETKCSSRLIQHTLDSIETALKAPLTSIDTLISGSHLPRFISDAIRAVDSDLCSFRLVLPVTKIADGDCNGHSRAVNCIIHRLALSIDSTIFVELIFSPRANPIDDNSLLLTEPGMVTGAYGLYETFKVPTKTETTTAWRHGSAVLVATDKVTQSFVRRVWVRPDADHFIGLTDWIGSIMPGLGHKCDTKAVSKFMGHSTSVLLDSAMTHDLSSPEHMVEMLKVTNRKTDHSLSWYKEFGLGRTLENIKRFITKLGDPSAVLPLKAGLDSLYEKSCNVRVFFPVTWSHADCGGFARSLRMKKGELVEECLSAGQLSMARKYFIEVVFNREGGDHWDEPTQDDLQAAWARGYTLAPLQLTVDWGDSVFKPHSGIPRRILKQRIWIKVDPRIERTREEVCESDSF
eukprot:GILJ01003087.1.p1 GENE.GILJ01003087.1~~GILJ01003087.1.p1  ORF type:complete len:1403 (-),score=222.23 GILJ01003087.1:43-4251(-)